jgi:hypothetical protein
MAALVIAEHDNASIKGATLNTVTAAAACGGDVHVLVAGHRLRLRGRRRGTDRRRLEGASTPTRGHFAQRPGRNVAAQVLAIAGNYSHILAPGHGLRQERPAARGRQLDVARSPTSPRSIARHLRAPHLRRQRHRHGAVGGCDQGHHGPRHRLRCRGGDRRFWRRRAGRGAGRQRGKSSFVGPETHQVRRVPS